MLLIVFAIGITISPSQAEQLIGPSNKSSTFGFYGTSPESPDGNLIAYVRYNQQPQSGQDHVSGELWICERNNPAVQSKVADIAGVPPHNGVELCWIDNNRVMIRDRPAGGTNIIRVIDVATGNDTITPVEGVGSGCQHVVGENAFFNIDNSKVSPQFPVRGIYSLNLTTGAYSLAIPLDDIATVLESNYQQELDDVGAINPVKWKILHLQPSPDGQKIAFRLDVAGSERAGRMQVTCLNDGSDLRLMVNKPNHALWYDSNTLVGHMTGFGGDISRDLHLVNRDGQVLELLSPISGNHLAVSPDRNYFATDTNNLKTPIYIFYLEKYQWQGDVLTETPHDQVVNQGKFHMNPSFSRDGTRVYYNKPLNDTRSGTFYFDLATLESGGGDGVIVAEP